MEIPIEGDKTKLTIPTTIVCMYLAMIVLKLDINMKTRIISVTSPNHELVTEIRTSRNGGVLAQVLCSME